MAHPYLTLTPTAITAVLFDLGYQAECDAVDGHPVAHVEALSDLLHQRREDLEVHANNMLWQRRDLIADMSKGWTVLDEASNRGDESTVRFCLRGLQTYQDRIEAIDRDLDNIGPVVPHVPRGKYRRVSH
jgi:hypothetical protein